ncbi:isopenicillin N synthase family dioxygenase [Roseateles sp. NT4]|uniref:isopenicillin N synthase family dioxygenase n=1 Tax=Roseateles sp. NT4 TaxID=3453715 RepID=UPI003EEEC652
MPSSPDRLPVIDLTPLRDSSAGEAALQHCVAEIRRACLAHGFFYVTGHGLPAELTARLEALARAFFARAESDKLRWPMSAGGRAWRGYFRAGGELTSGRPDWKEGLYLGSELPPDHPLVQAGTPLHGPNLWPDTPGLRETVLAYLDAGAAVCATVLRGIALSLGQPADYFEQRYTRDPLLLLRLFNYPSRPAPNAAGWGVGEHTDYGLLTLLYQDDTGGLEVHTPQGWVDAPPLPGTFVCNLGDMLGAATASRCRCSSTPISSPRPQPSKACPPRPMTAPRAGMAPACTSSAALMGTICCARSARSFPNWARRCCPEALFANLITVRVLLRLPMKR